MRENITTKLINGANNHKFIEGDWFAHGIPPQVHLSDKVYLETSYGFTAFYSKEDPALFMDHASGGYGVVTFITAEKGKIEVGKYTVLNEAIIICSERVVIGNHCMLGWGATITDTWPSRHSYSQTARQQLLYQTAHHPQRRFPLPEKADPVIIEDNCWIGFEAVILPGVRLGRGCVVGCRSVVIKDVPPYSVAIGNPARIVKYLPSDDTDEALQAALKEY